MKNEYKRMLNELNNYANIISSRLKSLTRKDGDIIYMIKSLPEHVAFIDSKLLFDDKTEKKLVSQTFENILYIWDFPYKEGRNILTYQLV